MQKFDADRLKPRDVQTQFETKFSVGSYLAYQGDRFVERFDANSYLTLDHGHRPVRSGRHAARSWPRRCGRSTLPLAADELHQRLALPAVPVARDRRRPDRRRQAGELLQRRERLRPRRLPAAQPDRHLRRADPRVPGQSRRGETGRGRARGARMGTSVPIDRPSRSESRFRLRHLPPSPPTRASSTTAGSITTRSSI